MALTASLLGAQQNRDSVENKPASLLVVSLGKTLNKMPPSLCGRQMVGPSSLPVVVAPTEDLQTERERQRSVAYIYTSSCIKLTTNSSYDEEAAVNHPRSKMLICGRDVGSGRAAWIAGVFGQT